MRGGVGKWVHPQLHELNPKFKQTKETSDAFKLAELLWSDSHLREESKSLIREPAEMARVKGRIYESVRKRIFEMQQIELEEEQQPAQAKSSLDTVIPAIVIKDKNTSNQEESKTEAPPSRNHRSTNNVAKPTSLFTLPSGKRRNTSVIIENPRIITELSKDEKQRLT